MLEIFQYDFMLRAFAAGMVIAVVAPVIGTFLVVRRYALIADTLAHVSLLGVSLSMLLGLNPIVGGLTASVLASAGIERLRRNTSLYSETLLAMFLSGSLALATILMSFGQGLGTRLFSYLFGSIATVTSQDVWIVVVMGIAVLGLVGLFFKELFLISLDEELAMSTGMRVRFLNMLLLVLTGIAVSIAMRIVGTLLIGALMVIPAISAMRFGRGFSATMRIAVMFSLVSVLSGLFISYYANVSSGGMIVVIALLFFIASYFAKE